MLTHRTFHVIEESPLQSVHLTDVVWRLSQRSQDHSQRENYLPLAMLGLSMLQGTILPNAKRLQLLGPVNRPGALTTLDAMLSLCHRSLHLLQTS
jgi:hypothetical protein